MEHVDADHNIGETASGEGDEAAVHVAAEEADASALLKGIIHEVGEQEAGGDLREDIDDAAEVAVGNVAVVTVDIPAVGDGIVRSFSASPQTREELLEKLVKHQEMEKNHQLSEKNQENVVYSVMNISYKSSGDMSRGK